MDDHERPRLSGVAVNVRGMEQERFAGPAAEALALAGELAAARPTVARALLEGRLEPEAAMVLCEALALLNPGADAEEQLVAAASAMTLDQLDAWVDDLLDAAPRAEPAVPAEFEVPDESRVGPPCGGADRSTA